jgi:hypothetical protein
MTELTSIFAAAGRELHSALSNMQQKQGVRRERWRDDLLLTLATYRRQCTTALPPIGGHVAAAYLDGMGEIAALRLLALYLPMLETLQRIERDVAMITGGRLWPEGDIRNYTGRLRRVEHDPQGS